MLTYGAHGKPIEGKGNERQAVAFAMSYFVVLYCMSPCDSTPNGASVRITGAREQSLSLSDC